MRSQFFSLATVGRTLALTLAFTVAFWPTVSTYADDPGLASTTSDTSTVASTTTTGQGQGQSTTSPVDDFDGVQITTPASDPDPSASTTDVTDATSSATTTPIDLTATSTGLSTSTATSTGGHIIYAFVVPITSSDDPMSDPPLVPPIPIVSAGQCVPFMGQPVDQSNLGAYNSNPMLVACDVNQDGIVNAADFTALATDSSHGSTTTVPDMVIPFPINDWSECNPYMGQPVDPTNPLMVSCDINKDGIINQADFVAVTSATFLNVTIVNDPSGQATTQDFTVTATTTYPNNQNSSPLYPYPLSPNGVKFLLSKGNPYSVTETSADATSSHYAISYSGDCSGTAPYADASNTVTSIDCTITNTAPTPVSAPITPPGPTNTSGVGIPSGGGGFINPTGGNSGGPGGGSPGGPNQGRVLGAAIGPGDNGTACGIYLDGYVAPSGQNSVNNIVGLQMFLNDYEGDHLPINGVYDSTTESAVDAFQLKYNTDILKPWSDLGLLPNDTTTTGYVYKTTRRMINNIVCLTLDLPIPSLQ